MNTPNHLITDVSTDLVKISRDIYGENVETVTCKSINLDEDLMQEIKNMTKGSKPAEAVLFFTILQLLTWKFSSKTNFTLPFPYKVFDFNSDDILLYINCQIEEEKTMKEFLNETKYRILEAYKKSLSVKSVVQNELDLPISFDLQEESMLKRDQVSLHLEELYFIYNSQSEGTVQIYFSPQSYSERLIESLLNTIKSIYNTIVQNVEIKIQDILIETVQNKVLEVVETSSLYTLLNQQFIENKEKIGLVDSDKQLTYHDIEKVSSNLADMLISKGVKEGDRVAVYATQSVDAVIMILGIYIAGATYIPLDIEAPTKRNQQILEDARPSIIITDEKNHLFGEESSLKHMIYSQKNFEKIEFELPKKRRRDVNSLLYVIYTSGTTGKPKGVLFRDKAMENLVNFQQQKCQYSLSKTVSQFASLAFDVASQEIWSTLCSGGCLVIVNEESKKDTLKFLEFFNRNKIQTSFLPTSFFKVLMSDTIGLQEFLSNVDNIIVAGEALTVNEEIITNIKQNNVHLYNHYGPSETHVVSIDEVTNVDVTIGKPIQNTQFHILDEKENELPFGAPGNLYIEGVPLADGYLNNEEKTTESFKLIYKSGVPIRMYNTGDVVRQLGNSKYEYLRRTDKQLKIRGYRVELQEVENTILNIDGVDLAQVIPFLQNKNTIMLAFYSGSLSENDLKEKLSKILPNYMIPSIVKKYTQMPLNRNGKIDSQELLLRYQDSLRNTTISSPTFSDKMMEKIYNVWKAVLGEHNIGTDISFFELGGNSINAMLICTQLSREFSISLNVLELFENDTIEKLYQYINDSVSKQEKLASIPHLEESQVYRLSPEQERMYFLQQFDLKSTLYNIPFIFKIKGFLDSNKLAIAFHKLVSTNDIFRTTYHVVGNEVVQTVNKTANYNIALEDLSDLGSLEEAEKSFIRPFDLSKDLLIRMGLYSEQNSQYLFIDMHHISSDGFSMNLIMNKLSNFYLGEDDKQVSRITYGDYAEYTKTDEFEKILQEQEEYWRKEFANYSHSNQLPHSQQSYSGDIQEFSFEEGDLLRIDEFAKRLNITRYVFLFSVFAKLINTLEFPVDIIGTPVSGRNLSELQNVVGLFVNTVPIRIPKEEDFNSYLMEFNNKIKMALLNQNYPFDRLIRILRSSGQLNSSGLFNFMFAYQIYESPLKLGDIELVEQKKNILIEKYDLTANVVDFGNNIKIQISFNTDKYSHEDIKQLLQKYVEFINNILDGEGI
ncbi:mutanobactin A non-ribosomal peptide synthetase MubB [Streptococcus mutans]|uniref:mutanobactin A non-ribosomal peptide synthetase MubB n=1 Tax=Streptococcus mutans TaxID=1309 RepID=UPI00403E99AC